MDDALPWELLLLSQAVVQFGAAQSDAISSAVQARMAAAADASRASLFTPKACLQLLDKMLAAEGLDGARLPELKQPNARTSIVLARKYYTARLVELRDKLGVQEGQMKKLLTEEKEIRGGAWDAKLTEGYDCVDGSTDPTQSLYKHKYSAGTVTDAQTEVGEVAVAHKADAAVIQPEPAAITGDSQPQLLPKEEAASPAKELHFTDEITTMPDTSMRVDGSSPIRTEREGTAGSTLRDVPEEDEEVEVDMPAQKREEDDEGDGHPSKDLERDPEASASTSRQTRRSTQPPLAKAGPTTTNSKGSAPERRSSSRVSRNSVANLSEIIPSTSSDGADMTVTSPRRAVSEEEGTSPAKEREPVAPSSEPVDANLAGVPMDREDSGDSTAGHASTSAGLAAVNRRGRLGRKSSVPPVIAKDTNKRKRTTTPQAQSKATSPAPSDRSRSKRIKTEEPESGLGTPVESDRTLGSSDASAIRRFRNSAPHLVSQMISSVNSTYFKEPVRQGEAKNYFEIIKKPMDLKTLLQNVKNGKITNSAEFTRDLTLIFANAIMYNGQDHHVGQDAVNMWKEAQGLLRVLEAAEQRAM